MQAMPQAPPRLVQTWHYLTAHWLAHPQLVACLCSCAVVCAHALLFVLMRCCLCSCAVVCAHALLFVLTLSCLCSCAVVCAHALLFVLMRCCLCSCAVVCAHALLFVLMLSCLCSRSLVCAHIYSLLVDLMGCVWRISTFVYVAVGLLSRAVCSQLWLWVQEHRVTSHTGCARYHVHTYICIPVGPDLSYGKRQLHVTEMVCCLHHNCSTRDCRLISRLCTGLW